MPSEILNGSKIYYEISGHGEPLVVILGLGASISQYSEITAQLATKYRVIVLDNRGTGKSDKPNTKYSIELMADDIYKLMNKLGIEKSNVLGGSMGGRIALELTLTHPEKVKKLILLSTFASKQKLKNLYLPLLAIKPLRRLHTYQGKNPQTRIAMANQLFATTRYDALDRLNNIKKPTLILHGKRDKMVSFKNAVELNNAIKNSKLIPFEGGHLFFDKKERQKFLSSVFSWL